MTTTEKVLPRLKTRYRSEIVARSRTAPSISLPSRAASPTPMFTTTFTTPGICITLS